MGLDQIQDGIGNTITKIQGIVGSASPTVVGSAAGAGAVIGASVIGIAALKKRRSKKTKKKSRSSRKKRKGRGRKLKFGSKAYRKKYLGKGKHKHRSSAGGKLTRHTHRKTKGIHYTSKGQPYIIMSSGKARFIKKSGAKRSKKQKGGRY